MTNIFPIDFEEKLTMAQDDYILFSDSEDGNKIKKAQYKNLKGEKGDPGTPGTDGKDGEDGAAATITVGSTTTGAAGSSASVTNSGTSSAAILDFTIPQGAKGEPGEDGQDGADGVAATITVGTTTTLPAGSSATVENVGTSQDAILNFGIPKGDAGTGSGDVIGPASSTDGDVAIFDGATGKAIKDGSVSLSTLSAGAALGATAIQPGDDISDLNNDSGFITGITSGDVTTALGYTPYNSTNPSGYITSSDIPTDVSDFNNDAGYLTSSTGVTSFNGSTGAITYTAPVTSVNGSTGAVTVSEFTPGGTATTGYVVTKTANGYEWSAPSGGDVMVSSQSGNILTSGMKIRAGTESDYGNLGTYDSNCLYLVIE